MATLLTPEVSERSASLPEVTVGGGLRPPVDPNAMLHVSAGNLAPESPRPSSMLRLPSVSQLLKITLGPPRKLPVAECRLCLASAQLYPLRDCGCAFCRQCLRQYMSLNIREGGVVLPCPAESCCGSLQPREIKEMAGPEIFALYQKYKLDRDVRKDSSLAWCPRGGCETVCQVVPNEPVWCPTCVHVFCPQCKREWHEDKPCPRNTSIDNLLLADGSNPGEEIKACPNCHVLIERNDGCAQMMCKFCEHIFCWHCLASLDEDVFLKHFDKGPCKNKLGHSKASLMWHRARVAAFMAGLGLLLLAVSPLLLLAAPCLLCRCKQLRGLLQDQEPPST